MDLQTLGYALAAGIAAFLTVFAAVAELLAPYVEFSVFVAIPAGLVAGLVLAAVVRLQRGRRTYAGDRLARALGAFGAVHLLTFVVGVVALRVGVVVALLVATTLGLVASVAVARPGLSVA